MNEQLLSELIVKYNNINQNNFFEFTLNNIDNLKKESNQLNDKLYNWIISLLQLLLLFKKYETYLKNEIKKNIINEDNFNEVKTYEEYINKIIILMDITKKKINVNFLVNNPYEKIKYVNKVTEDELLILNYNYINANYIYL